MDLRQLTTFLQVAELGSLSRAADRLRVAQPALSRQVRLLEEELRVPLFTRHGRGMVLTEAGETLRLRAAAILRQVEETREEVVQEAGAVRGRVTFGLTPTVGAVLSAPLVERFLALHPEVTLRIVQGFSGYLREWLQSGEVDIAVIYAGPGNAGVRQSPLLVETLCFVAPPGRGIGMHDAVPFAEVARERLVLPGPAHGLRKLVQAEAEARGLPLRIGVEADDLPVLVELVRRRLGCTVLPLAAVHDDVRAGRLCAAPIVEPHLSRSLAVAEPLGRQPSNAVIRFGEVLREEVAAMVRSGAWSGQLLGSDHRRA